MLGLKCELCKGQGYKDRTVREGSQLLSIKEWCEACKGTGRISYEGKREGVAWERE